jgi:hypothetical protein
MAHTSLKFLRVIHKNAISEANKAMSFRTHVMSLKLRKEFRLNFVSTVYTTHLKVAARLISRITHDIRPQMPQF